MSTTPEATEALKDLIRLCGTCKFQITSLCGGREWEWIGKVRGKQLMIWTYIEDGDLCGVNIYGRATLQQIIDNGFLIYQAHRKDEFLYRDPDWRDD